MLVVLDTNFLLLPFQKKIDLDAEVERVLEQPHFYAVLKQCLDELRGIASTKKKESRPARAALSLIKRRGGSGGSGGRGGGSFHVEKGFPGPADSALLACCTAKNAVLCTLDADLRRAAGKMGIRVIYLRGKSHLAITA